MTGRIGLMASAFLSYDDDGDGDDVSFTCLVERFIDENRLPHMLFYGPPGTGKTSTILACARKLYGPMWKSMTMEVKKCPFLCFDSSMNDHTPPWSKTVLTKSRVAELS